MAPPPALAVADPCTIVGTDGADVLTGTSGDDVICGLDGDDRIDGRGGDDTLRGGQGDDVVKGGSGDDLVVGGRGDDEVLGLGGDDRLRGGADDDELDGGTGDDRLAGGRGKDDLNGVDNLTARDFLKCGPAPDRAEADPDDVVRSDCEQITQNDAPTDVLLTDSTVDENEPMGTTVGVLDALDPDPGDTFSFTLVTGSGSADNNAFTISGSNLKTAEVFDFETDADKTVRVRATDEAGEFVEETLSVTVVDVNDPPVAVDDDASTTEDTTVDLPVSGGGSPAANDTDIDGGALSVTAVSAPSGGSANISAGQIHFVPTANLCGADAGSFTYTVSDGNGGTDSGTVTVDITCVNDASWADDDTKTLLEDANTTSIDVLGNDDDPEGDSITVIGVGAATHGTTGFTSSEVTYKPAADYCGPDAFAYTINGGDSATVAVTVTCVNDAPVAVDDPKAGTEDTLLSFAASDLTANDTDVDAGDALTVTAVSGSVGGSAQVSVGTVTFTPTANLCTPAPAGFDYTVSDGNGGTDTGHVTVTVSCVNDQPVANDDNRTVGEDSGATTFSTLLTNDTDVENDPITITDATNPPNGSTTFSSSSVTYSPDPDFCGADSFTYTVNGGDTATVAVTVTCVNDPPVANDDNRTVGEDSGATTFTTLRGNDADVESDPITITAASDPANGTTSFTAFDVTYTPDPDYCNDPGAPGDDTFTYTVDGGDSATVSVVVTCVDDAPTADDDTATVTLNDPATAVDVLANDDNTDGGPMTVASASDPTNGTVVLTGGTPGNHTGLTYEPDTGYCNTDPVAPADTFTYTLTPGGDSATVSVTVTCDVPPVAVDDAATVTEDAPATAIDVLANDTNPDDGPKVIVSVIQPTNGAVLLTPAGPGPYTGLTYEPDADYCNTPTPPFDTFTYALNGGDQGSVDVTVTCVNDPSVANDDARTVAEDSGATIFGTLLGNDTDVESDPITITGASDPANGATTFTAGDVTYTPDPNFCGADSFSYTINGGDTATVSVTVTCVPDAPTLNNSAGTRTYTEDTAPVAVDTTVTITNPDGLAITAGSVTLTNDLAGDVLDWTDSNPGDSITEGSSTALQVNLTGTGTANQWEAALEAVTFATPSQNPSSADRTATFSITTSLGSPTDTKLVDAANVDDLPVAVNDSATVLEDAAAPAVPVLTNDTDVDNGPKTITAVTDPANGSTVITGGGTGLTYQPDLNYCNDPGAAPEDTFTYTLNGSGAPAQTATVSMTVTCVNDAPVADDETFNGVDSAVGNTSLVVNAPGDGPQTVAGPRKAISGDILAGDTDVDGPNPLVLTAGTFATNDGGSVTLQADGDFTYISDPTDGCADAGDFFDYTVTDGNTPVAGTDTGRVTIAVTGCVWYVNNNDPGNAGTSTAPFDTLAQAQTASAAAHSIFVFDGDNTSTGYAAGIDLKANQKLVGEAGDLIVGSDTLHTAVPASRPTITDNNADVVVLAAGNELRGLNIDPQGTGGGIAGGAGDVSGAIRNVTVVDTGTFGTQPGLELDGTSGTWDISDLTVSTDGATGVRLNAAGTVNFASAGTTSLTSDQAKALDANGTSLGAGSVLDVITVTASTVGGVSIVNTTGTVALGDDSGPDLSLTTVGGTGLLLSNATNVTVGTGGTDNLNATAGPALDVVSSTGNFTFDDVDSTNSTTDGINLDAIGGSAFEFPATSAITGAAGIGFDLNGGGGANLVYDGTISTSGAASRPVEVTNRTSALVDFNGAVSGAGDGVNLASNGTATIRFDGGLTLNTAANTAFNATGGGTVVVTGAANTLNTPSASALNVVNTAIGAGGLTFLSINAGNNTAAADPANAIVLNNTGASGGLTVTGTGTTAGSGGTIQNTTGRGASFISTRDVSLKNMNFTNAGTSDLDATNGGLSTGDNLDTNAAIHLQTVTGSTALDRIAISGGAEQGINGNTVSGFSLTNSSITNAGNEADEDGIHFFNMSGTSAITSTTITSTVVTPNTTGGDDHLNLQMQSGTLNLTVNGGSATNANKGSGYLFGIRGTANATLTFTSASSTGNFSGGIVADAFDSSTMAVNVSNSTSSGNNDQLSVSAGDNSNVDLNATSNTLSSVAAGDFVVVSLLGSAFDTGYTFDSRIQNNSISVANGLTADGMLLFNAGGGAIRSVISGNTIDYAGTQRAIAVQAGQDGSGSTDLTVTGNTIDVKLDGAGNAVTGILAQTAITGPGNTSSLCADVGGAGGASNTFTHSLGGSMAGGDVRLRQRNDGTVRLPGYAGGATDLVAAAAYLNGRNVEVSPATATADSTGFAGGGACAQPVP